ncbi:ATP-binding protein, partial [Helicobacter pylori]|nr:ATP-binding protein [Helicobacter pylori]
SIDQIAGLLVSKLETGTLEIPKEGLKSFFKRLLKYLG